MATFELLELLPLAVTLPFLLVEPLLAKIELLITGEIDEHEGAHSSGLIGLNCTPSSVYSLRQAGHCPLRFSLIWCQQNLQI